MSEKIIAYKGMDKNMTCRGKQYEVGKTYTEERAKCCNAGMHACENPLDVLHYYRPDGKTRFFEVECGGEIDREDGKDSKLACTELKINGELRLAKILKIGAEATIKRVNEKVEESKKRSKAGDSSVGSAAGNSSVGSAAGNYSVGSAAGNYSVGSAAGDCSVGSAAGYSSVGSAAGNSSVGSAAGDYSKAEALGKDSIAVANGAHSKARGAMGCYLVLTEYDDDDNFLWAKMAQVDGSIIKEKVWYTLENGEFVEAKP